MKNITLLFFLISTLNCLAQQTQNIIISSEALETKSIVNEAPNFPDKCIGVWEGMMYIYSYNTLRDSVKVRFTAAKTDTAGTYIWKKEYLSTTRPPMVKDYKLVVDDLSKGRYLLDEGGGVKLIEYNVANKLYSLFKVEDIYLTSSTELVGDQLVFEVTSGKEVNMVEGITNYAYANVQRVVMRRVDE